MNILQRMVSAQSFAETAAPKAPAQAAQRNSGEFSPGGKAALVLFIVLGIWGLNALVFGPLPALLVFPVVGLLSFLFDRNS
jgi:hypothetical protein